MIKAGGGFRFPTKTLQMPLRRPMAEADDFQRDGAIKTFLPRAINHTLATTTDYLHQFIIAKVRERFCRSRRFLFMWRSFAIVHAGVTGPGYRFVREQIEAGLKQTRGTKAFRCVGKNLRSAFSTNPGCAAHNRRVGCALPIMYCADFWHTLRSQHSNQMAQFIFDIAGHSDSVTDFFAQQKLITLTKAMEGLAKGIIRHA